MYCIRAANWWICIVVIDHQGQAPPGLLHVAPTIRAQHHVAIHTLYPHCNNHYSIHYTHSQEAGLHYYYEAELHAQLVWRVWVGHAAALDSRPAQCAPIERRTHQLGLAQPTCSQLLPDTWAAYIYQRSLIHCVSSRFHDTNCLWQHEVSTWAHEKIGMPGTRTQQPRAHQK
jgi:hypothetical protein